jgi:hypothetical protein
MRGQNGDNATGYERRDSAPLTMTAFGIAISILLIAVLWASSFLKRKLQSNLPDARGVVASRAPGEGRGDVPRPASALDELATLRAEEHLWLNSYHWISRKDGTVHIPIQRAIELVIQEVGRNEAVTTRRAAAQTNESD